MSSFDLSIYLSGSIKKGKTDYRSSNFYWTNSAEELLASYINRNVTFHNPAKINIVRNDYIANFGCDLFLVSVSDIVVVDLREGKGVGVGAELMFAYQQGIPVIGWSPRNSKYRKDRVENVYGEDLNNWIHPFVAGLCDYVEEDLLSIGRRIQSIFDQGRPFLKTVISPEDAIRYFLSIYPDFNQDGTDV